jgi:hypothetical protein
MAEKKERGGRNRNVRLDIIIENINFVLEHEPWLNEWEIGFLHGLMERNIDQYGNPSGNKLAKISSREFNCLQDMVFGIQKRQTRAWRESERY